MTGVPMGQQRLEPIPFVHNFAAISATSAAAAGVPVIPLRPGTKLPLHATGGGHLEGSLRDPQTVLDETADFVAEFQSPPGWGIVTGGKLVVLDLDGDDAAQWLDTLAEEHPEVATWRDATVRVRTARGLHLYGTIPESARVRNSAGKLGTGVDVRGKGGYVVAPGTRHPSGAWYSLDTDAEANASAATDDPDPLLAIFHDMRGEGDEFTVASVSALSVPDTLLDLMLDEAEETETSTSTTSRPAITDTTARRRFEGLVRTVQTVERGQGNAALNRAAGVTAALGIERSEAEPRLVKAYLSRPTSEGHAARRREALATIASGWRWGTEHPDKALRERPSTGSAPHEERRARERSARPDSDKVPVTDDPENTLDDLGEAFFESRAWLHRLRDFARARRVAPWALVGVVLARAAAAVPPSTVLPPTRGSVASLNTFVAICGDSGSGKSAVAEAARDFLVIEGGVEVLETAPGSGEGLIAAYVIPKTTGSAVRMVQTRRSVLLEVDEVQALGSLTARTASTLLPFLKSAWSGKLLATQNADPSRQRRVDPHNYRLAITAGVQPANASILLDDAAGGFPQRWLWLPTYDTGMIQRGVQVTEPPPFKWKVPGGRAVIEADGTITLPLRSTMQLPAEAVDAILDAAVAQNRPIGAGAPIGADALDGHALLARTKIAALLALLDGREIEVNSDDWMLAGIVMEVSDHTRGEIIAANAQTARVDADRRAERQGRSAAIAADAQTEERTVRALRKLRELLADGDEHPEGGLRKKLRHYREEFPEAVERLIEIGEVERTERDNTKGRTTVYLQQTGETK